MGYLPAGGFIHLTTSTTFTVNVIKRVVVDLCKAYGDVEPFFDEAALKKSAELWREVVVEWSATYSREFEHANGRSGAEETLSHIKHAGSLLYAFTQSEEDGVVASLVRGILPERIKDLVEGYPNEVLIFLAVYWLFNEQQYQRADAELLYDYKQPPMNPRYLRSMAAYLNRTMRGNGGHACKPADLYLIFKTMDLMGAKTEYKS